MFSSSQILAFQILMFLLHVHIADFKNRHSLLFSLRLLVSRSHQELTTPKRARMGCGWMVGRETGGEKCVHVREVGKSFGINKR